MGPNVWPAEEALPNFRADVSTLYSLMTPITIALFRAFAEILELEDLDAFARHATENSRATMRLLRDRRRGRVGGADVQQRTWQERPPPAFGTNPG